MANCLADVGAGFTQGELFVELDYPGSQDLQPENADTFTVGLVFEPAGVESLAVTLDYYKIDIEDSIRNIPPSAALEQCYLSANKSHPTCNDIFRDGFTGDVVFLVVPLINAASEEMSGVDLGVRYAFEAAGSEFTFNWDLAYLDQFDVRFAGAESTFKLAGTISNGEGGNGSYTQLRSNLSLGVDKEKWGASYHISYIGDADSQFQRLGATTPTAASANYHSLEGHIRLTDNIYLRGGINNLFDKAPAYYTDPIDQNTDPFTYDLLGRRFFVKASYTF
jgi:outer membrane receptor protein involved in Fe transport